MSEPQIIMYGTSWCSDCHRSKNFLNRHQVTYKWVDVDKDQQGLEYVRQVNNGNRVVPTIVFPDGEILVEPSNMELGKKIGVTAELFS